MALGSGEKAMSKSELACKRKLGKTIVAKRKIGKGEVVSSNDVVVKVSASFHIPFHLIPS